MILHAISIRQPFAHRILCSGKDVENRTWKLPTKYYGLRVLIHAGLSTESMQSCSDEEANVHLGGIVGIVTLVGCILDGPSPWAIPRYFHWLLANAKPLPFHPCKGRLGFFEVDYPHEVPT